MTYILEKSSEVGPGVNGLFIPPPHFLDVKTGALIDLKSHLCGIIRAPMEPTMRLSDTFCAPVYLIEPKPSLTHCSNKFYQPAV